MKKNILITFDYELFLGARSGKPEECMIVPTNAILKSLEPFGVKAIFFVDTTYLITLEKLADQYPACKKDLETIGNQIQTLVQKGHYVFPHIHPHWLDAIYNAEEHEFNLTNVTRYRFHNLNNTDKKLVVNESMRILRSITSKVNKDYVIDGFRAGGWSIQPVSDFLPYLKEAGIKFDFSVLTKLYQFSNVQYFDFSDAPDKTVYRFGNDITKEDPEGEMTQISCSVIYVKPHIKMMDRILSKYLFQVAKDRSHGNGEGQQSIHILGVQPRSKKGQNAAQKIYEAVSVENLSLVKLASYMKFIEENEYIHFVSHPKMLIRHNLRTLEKFLKLVSNKYEIETDFRKTIPAELLHQEKKVINEEITKTSPVDTQISVIVPCYNVEEYIDEGLRSVLTQTFAPLEILCIDDGSSDNTVSIIRELQKEFPDRIRLLVNEQNRGATYTRNRGLAIARGEYIQFFDADDLLLPFKFEYQNEVLNNLNYKPDILIGSCKKLFLDGTEKVYTYHAMDPWCALLDAMLGVTTSNLFRREKVLEINGWMDGLKSSQEYDLMFRMLQKGAKVQFDTKQLNVNREREFGSITKTNPAEKWKRFINLRTRIYDYLKESNQLTEERKQTFVNIVFDAARILYIYDKQAALELHKKYILNVGTPSVTLSTSERFLSFYRILGFEKAQSLSKLINPSFHKVH